MGNQLRRCREMGFTCTERPGKENFNELIAEPLVTYINEMVGRKVLKVKKKEVTEKEIVLRKRSIDSQSITA
jgi:hypothetical protein